MTRTAETAKYLAGDELYQKRARKALPLLVAQAQAKEAILYCSPTVSRLRGEVGEGRALSYLRENLAGLGGETLADFVEKNREGHPVEPDFDPDGRLTCLGGRKFHDVFGDGWERFRRMFPDSDGTLRFSRIGLDRSVTRAVIYAGQQFDWNVGSGGYRPFSKTDGSWIERARVGTWIS